MQIPAGFGVNLVASIATNVGLGVLSRGLAGSLERHGVPFSIVSVGHDWGGTVPLGDLGARVVPDSAGMVHPVNLYAVPLVAFEKLFQECPWLLGARRMHVLAMMWEASALPPAWIDTLGRFDAVLAASGFIANLAANALPTTAVIEAPFPLQLPEGVRADRGRFGLPEEATVFAASLDPNSDPARKNPLGHVQAFRQAFPPDVTDVRLAIRVNNADTSLGRATLDGITQAAGGDPRVSLILGPLTYAEVLGFYASSDVFVSLHRGEGLGLPLMESMALGKPVIATAWSGNTSFMDYGCACPVRFRKVRVVGHWKFFQPSFLGARAFWADPILEDAVAWMRRLHADRGLRERIGRAASERIRAYSERAWTARWIEEMAALWQARDFLPGVEGKLSSA